MYLPEDFSTDYRFAHQQPSYQNGPYYPHFCNFVFKVSPSTLTKDGYIESDPIIVDKIPWKIFVKADGKELYPFLTVGIVDHNNVEEISYKITLKGIKAEYDETRHDTVIIKDKTNKKLCCDEKIWYHTLFDIPDCSNTDPEMPLIFHISIKYRCPGEKYEYVPFRETYHSLTRDRSLSPSHRRSRKHHPRWDSTSFDVDDMNLFDLQSLQYYFILYGLVFLIIASHFEINPFYFAFQILCYLLSFAFTLIFFIFDCFYYALYYPFMHYSETWNFFTFFFSNSANASCNDTVSSTTSSMSYFGFATNLFHEN